MEGIFDGAVTSITMGSWGNDHRSSDVQSIHVANGSHSQVSVELAIIRVVSFCISVS